MSDWATEIAERLYPCDHEDSPYACSCEDNQREIAAALRAAYERGRSEEREACAARVEAYSTAAGDCAAINARQGDVLQRAMNSASANICATIAREIRARGTR